MQDGKKKERVMRGRRRELNRASRPNWEIHSNKYLTTVATLGAQIAALNVRYFSLFNKPHSIRFIEHLTLCHYFLVSLIYLA